MNDQKKTNSVALTGGSLSRIRPNKKKRSDLKKAPPGRSGRLKKISEMTPAELSKQKKLASRKRMGRFSGPPGNPAMKGMQYPIRDSAKKAFSRSNFQ
jgi:hypothetical protein